MNTAWQEIHDLQNNVTVDSMRCRISTLHNGIVSCTFHQSCENHCNTLVRTSLLKQYVANTWLDQMLWWARLHDTDGKWSSSIHKVRPHCSEIFNPCEGVTMQLNDSWPSTDGTLVVMNKPRRDVHQNFIVPYPSSAMRMDQITQRDDPIFLAVMSRKPLSLWQVSGWADDWKT